VLGSAVEALTVAVLLTLPLLTLSNVDSVTVNASVRARDPAEQTSVRVEGVQVHVPFVVEEET
jgi:hypothetical protein